MTSGLDSAGIDGQQSPERWPGAPADYLPIAEHGIIGDLRTAALVGSDGTIDWFSPHRFDGPGVFAALLDRDRGGFYRIAPADPHAATKQMYLPDTNVLVTRFLSPEGVGEVQDFMPVGDGPQRLIRSVVGVRGAHRFRLEVEPRFDYGLHEPQLAIEPEGVVFRAPGQSLVLCSPLGLEPTGAGARAEFEVAAEDRRTFVLQAGDRPVSLSAKEAERLAERELEHLDGYSGSHPVRIGNSAATQLQLDVYGELFDSIYLAERQALSGRGGELIAYDDWLGLARLIDWLCDHWQEPDEGIWGTRGGRKRFTYSRLMSWVAIDRAIRIADRRGLPADLATGAGLATPIFAWVLERGWSERRRAFVQAEGADLLDASLLLMPLVRFIAPTDPRWLSTLSSGELLGNFPQAFTHLALISAAIRLDRSLQTGRA